MAGAPAMLELDRIVCMHQGTILAEGTPDEIRRNESVTTTLIGTPAS